MRIVCLLLLAGCGAPQHTDCTDSPIVLARAIRDCADMRGGISGYSELEIVEGPGKGAIVFATYGDIGGGGLGLKNWNVAYAQLVPAAPVTGWPNQCGDNPPALAGQLLDIAGFDTEAEARNVFAEKRCTK